MKFKLEIEGGAWDYSRQDAIDFYKPLFEKWGFEFRVGKDAVRCPDERYKNRDGHLKTRIVGEPVVEIDTVEKMLDLNKDLVITGIDNEIKTIYLERW